MASSSSDRDTGWPSEIALPRSTRRCVALYGHVDDLLPTIDGSALRLPEQVALAADRAGLATIVASEADGLRTLTPPGTPPPAARKVMAGAAPLRELLDQAIAALRQAGQPAILLLTNAHAAAERDEVFWERLRDMPFDRAIAACGLQVVATFREPVAPPPLQGATGWDIRPISLPGLAERRDAIAYWARIGVAPPGPPDLAELASLTGGLELDEVRRLIAEHVGYEPLTPHRISEVRSAALKRQLNDMLEVNHHPDISFDDVVGGEAVKSAVRMAQREHRYAPIALVGPPGVGKTMLATAAARELGVPIIYVDGRLKGGIVGETARNLARFRELLMAYAPVVAFWDEIDLLLGRSTDYNGDSGTSNEVRQTVLTLLQDAGSLGIFIIASCNNPLSALQFRVRNRLRLIPVLHPVGPDVLAIAKLEARKLGVVLAEDTASVFTAADEMLWNGRDIAKILRSAKANALGATGTGSPAEPVVLTARDLRLLVRYFAEGFDAAAELNALEAVYVTENPYDLPWIGGQRAGAPRAAVPPYLAGVIDSYGIPDRHQIAKRLAEAGVHDAR
jgi:SpoVK/Ycf46/Vps4 family AAA+-type ATPase